MALRTKTPGEGGGKRRTHFIHVKTAHGENWHAHVAGPCHWFECHTKGRTKPCLHWLTRGELKCERCDPLKPAEDIGYVPLFRELDGRPCFVVVHDYVRDTVDALRHHQRVVVGRAGEQSDGVYVVPALNPRPLYQTTRPEFRREVDLTQSLLRVWGIPELVEWYNRTQAARGEEVPLPEPEPVKSDGQPFDPMHVAAARRFAPAVTPEVSTGDDAVRESLKRIQEGSAKPNGNGKHKAPPKG